ncbi:MAG: ATPase, T2SS/T4P/T4SS family [Candidatus Omnitrophota bacterium]
MESRVISFFSTKGGVGKTLISLNLAVSLALKNKKVFHLDLGLGAPQETSKLLGTKSKYSLFNLIGHLGEFKSKKRNIRNYIGCYKNNLFFLPAISKISQGAQITDQGIKDFISVISREFDYVLIDAGSNLSDNLIATLDSSNIIFLILTPDILSVYQTEWLLDTLQSLGFPLKMIKIILNRAESKGSISWQEIKMLLPSEVIALIPSEGRTIGLAVNRGIPVVIDSPNSKAALALNKLADLLIGKKDLYIEHKSLADIRVAKEEGGHNGVFWQKSYASGEAKKTTLQEEEDQIIRFKRRVHQRLITELDLKNLSVDAFMAHAAKAEELRKRAERIISNIISKEAGGFISSLEIRKQVTKEILDEALGFGPLEDLIGDPSITEIMVNNKDQVYIEKKGKLELTSKRFTTNEQVKVVIERILAPLGRRIDESVPYVDARLPDGSRVNALIPPLSLTGPTLTIRKFSQKRFTVEDLIQKFDSLSPGMAKFLDAAVKSRKNILVSGGTGSGKTTLLNIISSFIPEGERIVTIEDSAELKLDQAHWIRLESRTPNIEGKGGITIKDLFRNTLRMRPDRIIVGESRGGEALDMLQAMNTGHDGSLSTIHANSTQDVLIRLDSMILMSGIELPIRSIREMVSSAIDLIVHVARLSDGSRKVVQIAEVVGMLDDVHIDLKDIFRFSQTGVDAQGGVLGKFTPLGYIPSFYEEIQARGIDLPREIFITKD